MTKADELNALPEIDKSALAAALQRAIAELRYAKQQGWSMREFEAADAEIIVAAARATLSQTHAEQEGK